MIKTILCLATLALLAWVIVLKREISRLKAEANSSPSPKDETASRSTSDVKGMRSFKIG